MSDSPRTCPNCSGLVWYSPPLSFPNTELQLGIQTIMICESGCGYDTMLVGVYDWFYDEYRTEILASHNKDIEDLNYLKSSQVKGFIDRYIDVHGHYRED